MWRDVLIQMLPMLRVVDATCLAILAVTTVALLKRDYHHAALVYRITFGIFAVVCIALAADRLATSGSWFRWVLVLRAVFDMMLSILASLRVMRPDLRLVLPTSTL